MSDAAKMILTETPDGDEGFTITRRGSCWIVMGAIPLRRMGDLTRLAPEGATWDTALAQHFGASLVMGLPEDCARLRETLRVGCRLSCEEVEDRAGLSLDAKIDYWLRHGEPGISSKAIAYRALGDTPEQISKKLGGGPTHPRDADDLRRCRDLIGAIPEIDVSIMADVSATWGRLTPAWQRMLELLEGGEQGWREVSEMISALLDDAQGS